MRSAEEFERDTFDPEVFFREHWRKKPLYVRGGAPDFLGRRFSAAEFDAVLARARQAGHPVAARGEDVVFIENASRFESDLAGRANGFAELFGAPKAWFDTVRTGGPDGIGAHFDHSDNFVLQQEGTKEWSLAAPSNIDRAQIALRMMNAPGVGSHELPGDAVLRFTVEAGDLLYIPLLWLHSGVSIGPSLSVSLVCPATSLYSAVIPALGRAARERALGYQPVPAFHAHMAPAEKAAAAETLRGATRAFIARLSDDELCAAVFAEQGDSRIDAGVAHN